MALLPTTNPTLADVAKRTAPDGSLDTIVEIMNETNEMLIDMPWKEGNLPTGHRTTIRTGIPEPTFRTFYGGVLPTKSETAQVTDNCAMLEAYAKVDKDLADLNGNAASFRFSEDRAHMEGMSQKMAETVLYGNDATDPTQFMGLAPRFSTGNTSLAGSADNVLNAGGTGSDNTSIWLIGWGEESVCGIYPRASRAGLSHRDLGEDTHTNADGSEFQIYRSHYQWKCGLTVKDWRYVVRIANIDVSALQADPASGGANLFNLMGEAIERLPTVSSGRPVFYCNRTIRTFLRNQQKNVKNVQIGLQDAAGRKVMTVDEIPVRRVDKLVNTEAAVTGF